MKSNTLLHIFLAGALLMTPVNVSGSGWGTPVATTNDTVGAGNNTALSNDDNGDVFLPSSGSYSTNQNLTSPNGWGNANSTVPVSGAKSRSVSPQQGSMDISPSRKMISNPWFKASDFLPNPDEYKAPLAEEKASIKDNILNPVIIWVETVEKDGKAQRSNFKALYLNEEVFIPVITLPRMFKTKVQWKAAEQKLFIHKGASSLNFSLDGGLKVDFFGDDVSFGERLIYYQKMLFVPVKVISEFFKYKVFWSSARKLLHFIKRVTSSPALQKKWDKTLKDNNLYSYAKDLQKKQPSSTVHQQGIPSTTNQVFNNVWGTSEEPQTIACAGLRGDWKLRASDMAIALPSRKALMKKVFIRYRKTGKIVKVTVVDVGPWNIDDPYWIKDGGRPAAEINSKKFYSKGYKKTNLAGIDLAYEPWVRLGVPRSVAYSGNFSAYVDWWFE